MHISSVLLFSCFDTFARSFFIFYFVGETGSIFVLSPPKWQSAKNELPKGSYCQYSYDGRGQNIEKNSNEATPRKATSLPIPTPSKDGMGPKKRKILYVDARGFFKNHHALQSIANTPNKSLGGALAFRVSSFSASKAQQKARQHEIYFFCQPVYLVVCRLSLTHLYYCR